MASLEISYEERKSYLEKRIKNLEEENQILTHKLSNLGEHEHNLQTSLRCAPDETNTKISNSHPSKYPGAAEEVESSLTVDGVQLPKEPQLKVKVIRGSVSQNAINDNIGQASMADAGGWRFFRKNNPTNAGGAAGALYREMRIKSFSSEVQKIELGGALVVYYQIGKKKNKKTPAIIHTAGINFNLVPDWTPEQSQESLNRIYTEIFCAHISTNRKKFFFPPISGGRFSGRFKETMPQMQRLAIQKGFEKLSTEHQTQLRESDIYLCLYESSEFETYKEAGFLS